MTTPLITVITVCYNARNALLKSLESVVSQDYANFEYIVIDGGSSDGTIEVLQAHRTAIRDFVSEPDGGTYDAMNKGLHIARGEYIHYLNAGDTYLSPQSLTVCARLLVAMPALLMNRVIATVPATGKAHTFPRTLGHSSPRAAFSSAYCHQGALVRRVVYLANGGFDTRFPRFADFKALWLARQSPLGYLETTALIAHFPLDGVSSDWRRAPDLYIEKERLLSCLGARTSLGQYWLGLLRAYLYRLKMRLTVATSSVNVSH